MSQTEKPVHIVNVPLDLGASRRGTDAGPSAFRIAGLRKAVSGLGYTISEETDIPVPIMETRQLEDSNARFKDEILSVCVQLAEQTKDILDSGETPLVIGGDHSIAMGTVSGASAHFRQEGKKVDLVRCAR